MKILYLVTHPDAVYREHVYLIYMKYRQLGKTGLRISIISFGSATLGNEYGNVDAKEGERAVHCAIDQGINMIDSSPYYGRTLSESRLGTYLRNGWREKVVLATKAGRYGKDQFDFSEKRIISSLEESLVRLKTDRIDILQLHDIDFAERNKVINEGIPALLKLKEQGKIRFAGVTGYPVFLLREMAEKFKLDVVLSFCHYNLMNTVLEKELLSFPVSESLGIINGSPLHMGILTQKGPPPWHGAPDAIKQCGKELALFCAKEGDNITSLALQFALCNEKITSTLVGMESVKEVRDNISILERPMNKPLLEKLQQMVSPLKNVSWPSGIPENHETKYFKFTEDEKERKDKVRHQDHQES